MNALADVARAMRFLNVAFGAWLIAAPWLLGGVGSSLAPSNGVICGVPLIGLAIPRGPIKATSTGWNRYVF